MKKIVLLVTLMFSLFLFSACTPTSTFSLEGKDYIALSLDISSNGKVVQSLDFSLGSGKLSALGEDMDKESFKQNLIKNVEQLRLEFLMNFSLIYVNNPVEDYKFNKGILFSAVTYDERQDSVGFDILFDSIASWNYYHNNSASQENGNKKLYLFKKNTSTGVFPFSAKQQIGEDETVYVGDRYAGVYLSSAEGTAFAGRLEEEYKPLLVYNYSTFSSSLRSDADYKGKDNNGHSHHIWVVEQAELTGENIIRLTSYQVNVGMCYLTAIIVTVAVGLTLTIIFERKRILAYIKQKIKKKI